MGGAATLPKLKPHSHQTPSSSSSSPTDPTPPTTADRRVDTYSDPFAKGCVVEVRTDEADFKDTFFSATVISPPVISPKKRSCKKKSEDLVVEYHSLYKDEDGSERLKETVDISCVRPWPALQEVVEGYLPEDAVDAFYQEGWWIGVVARVVEEEGDEKRYVVTFRNPPDEQEFGFSELRVHWDWVNGRWVRPERQSIAGLMFDVGRKVEVSIDREDGQIAWFPATIHQDLANGDYMVECSGADTDNKVQTRIEKFDSRHLRPWPPLLKDKNFVLLEKVDAFYDFGHWTGIIKQVLENNRYLVFFKQMNTLKEFNQSELRAHMEWKNGKWFTSSQDISFPNSEGGMHERLCASVQTVPGNNLGDGRDTSDERISPSLASGNDHTEELTSDFQKTSPVKFIRKRRRHLSDPRNVFSHSPKKLKEGTVLRSNQQKKHDSVIKEMLNESVSPGAEKNVETTGNQSATGDQSSGNPSWGMRTRRNQRNVSSMKNNSAQMNQDDNMEIDVGGKEPDAAEKTADGVQNEETDQEIVVPVVIGLPCAEMMSPGFGKSKGKRSRGSNSKESVSVVSEEKRHLLDSPNQKTEDMKLIEFGELSEKRKRGRPRKIPTESIETPATDDLNKKADDPTGVPEVEVIDMATTLPIQEKTMLIKEKTVFVLSETKDRKVLTPKRISLRKHEEKVVKESIIPEENPVSKRGRKSTSERIAPQVSDSPVAAGEKTAEVVKSTVEEVVSETRGIEFENQPLSKWFDGMHTPPSIDDSRVPDVDAVGKRIENGDKQKDSLMLLEITEKQQESSIIQSLPFAKNNFLWKTIESMEVFQKIPQNPHFQPLEQFKESSREGKAIGLMVIFSNVVEKTCKLRIDDPISVTDDILDTLAELEKHGFTVGGLQARVDKLIDLKVKEEKLVDEVKGLTVEILEHDVEKRKILEEMDELNEQIRKLQEKLSVIESAKVKKEDEIVSLAIRLKETEESIKKARSEFEGIVSSEL